MGTLEGFEAKISIDPNAAPIFSKARSVPYALRDKVEAELERLVNEGTLEPVQFADWASPIVAILKNDRKSDWICGAHELSYLQMVKILYLPSYMEDIQQ